MVRSRHLASLLCATLVLLIVLATALALWIARTQEMQAWQGQLDNLSLVLAEQTAGEMKSASLILESVAEQVQTAGVDTPSQLASKMGSAAVLQSLVDKKRALAHIDMVMIVGHDGRVLNVTRNWPAPPIALATRGRGRGRDAPGAMAISRPLRNPGNGGWTFYLSRPLHNGQGEVLGTVLVGVSSTVLSAFYEKIRLGADASIALHRQDGTLLARWPHSDTLMGQAAAPVPAAPRAAATIGAVRAVPHYPVTVSLRIADTLYLARWRPMAAIVTLVAGCGILAVLLTFAVLARAQRRREADFAETMRLRTEAEAASRAKSEFLATMSHEIRTPLTAIIGFAEMLDTEADPVGRRESAEVIVRNGRHLLAIINDILDMSKIEAGRMQIDHVAFSPIEVVLGLDTMMRAQAASKGIVFRLRIDYPFPSQVMGDPTRWRQVLFNLCGNAIKFTELGTVDLRLWYQAGTQQLHCSVADTGIGISDEHRARLFMPFTQADGAVARKYGGTGLGLHLVHRLSERMGGAVQVDSAAGRGACFEVRVAAPPAPEMVVLDALPAPLPVHAAIAPPALVGRVLLAEDGPDNRMLVGALLRGLGLEVLVAEDGAGAIELALEHRPDLILMDIQMPVLDGLQATAVLRASGYGGPIIALTANVMADDVQRYLRSGFDHYVAKPIERADLAALLGTLLGGATAPGPGTLADLPEFAALRQMFEDNLHTTLALMERLAGAGDLAGLAAQAHMLKGSAASFGRPAAGQLAGAMERAASAGDAERACALLARLRSDIISPAHN